MSQLFDCYLAVDWSAANAPTRGKDSIWISTRWGPKGREASTCENIPTRSEAIERLAGIIGAGLANGHRIFAGFDFAFGFPAGVSGMLGGGRWEETWSLITDAVSDDEANRSNRFDVGSRFNHMIGRPMFWGKPHQHMDRYEHLPAKKPQADHQERRVVEQMLPGAKSVFQLAYNGAVGSQTLLGIARLQKLRAQLGDSAKVWPFETSFAANLPAGPSVVLAEIYPSLVLPRAPAGEVKDKAQVKAYTSEIARLDRRGALRPLLDAPPGVTEEERAAMLREEGSIVGAGVL